MIANMPHEPARASASAELMRAGRETSRLSMVFRYAIAGQLGLTVSDLECLDYLADVGSATAGQVAERTNLTTGAVTSMLRRLERAGYLASEWSTVGGRKRRTYQLTSSGAKMLASGKQEWLTFRAVVEGVLRPGQA